MDGRCGGADIRERLAARRRARLPKCGRCGARAAGAPLYPRGGLRVCGACARTADAAAWEENGARAVERMARHARANLSAYARLRLRLPRARPAPDGADGRNGEGTRRAPRSAS